MPSRGPKPSEIAVEAKRYYIPKVESCLPDIPARSFAYTEVAEIGRTTKHSQNRRLRIAVLDKDAVDVALHWNYEFGRQKAQDPGCTISSEELRIPLIVPVDEKRAGGDWESSSMGPEENLCRRSNFVRCLARSRTSSAESQSHPIPSRGGIYSPQVVIFRSGSKDNYTAWDIAHWTWLPVISVAPGRRPKLKPIAQREDHYMHILNNPPTPQTQPCDYDYTFAAERELMLDKIRTALRLAATWNHRDIVVGSFGCGPGFRNPARQLSAMWKRVLFEEEEFRDVFDNVVFAIEHVVPPQTTSSTQSHVNGSTHGGTSAASTGSPSSSAADSPVSTSGSGIGGDVLGMTAVDAGTSGGNGTGTGTSTAAPMSDYEIFKQEFEPKSCVRLSMARRHT